MKEIYHDYDLYSLRVAAVVIFGLKAVGVSEKISIAVIFALTGWSAGIGLWAQIVGGLFTLLAMLTTYWSLSLALSDIVRETLKWNEKLSWLVDTLPSLILALVNLGGFMGIMRTAGGLISIIIAVMVVPAFINSKKAGGESILKHNGAVVCGLMIPAYILMGVGSVVPG